MKKALDDLFFGELDGLVGGGDSSGEYQKVIGKISKLGEEIQSGMNKEQKRLYLKYSDLYGKLELNVAKSNFIHGFSVGARLVAEAFCGKEGE